MARNYDAFRQCGDYRPQDELDDLMDFISDAVAEMPTLGYCTDVSLEEVSSTHEDHPGYNPSELRTEKKDD